MSEAKPPAAKRFYNDVAVHRRDESWTILIDNRQLRTPGKHPFMTPIKALMDASAKEWRAQTSHVRPETMPITRLLNVAIDSTSRQRDRVIESIAGYAATDLVCHRADAPTELVERQARAWDPLVEWARTDLRAPLEVVTGVIAAEQPYAAGEAFAKEARAYDDFKLTALAHAVGVSGSAVLGLAMARGLLPWQKAFELACLDDLWQLEHWGEDSIARERLNGLRAEFENAGTFFTALG